MKPKQEQKQIISYSEASKLSQITGIKPEEALSLWEAARQHNQNPTPETAIALRQALEVVEGEVRDMLIESFSNESIPDVQKVGGVRVRSVSHSSRSRTGWTLLGIGLGVLVIAFAALLLVSRNQNQPNQPTVALLPATATTEAIATNSSSTAVTESTRPTLPPTWTPSPTPLPDTPTVMPVETSSITNTASIPVNLSGMRQCASDDIAAAQTGVTSNADWKQHACSKPFNDVEMVLVPKGEFMMGGYSTELLYVAHSQPIDQAFWFGKTEVSLGEYQRCVDAGVCIDALHDSRTATRLTQPVTFVTWEQAKTYCAWRGAYLPTELKWEYAGRGPDSLNFPFGIFDPQYVVYNANSGGQPVDVNTYPEGQSWVGALHLSGNVWEMTSSLFFDYPYNPAIHENDNDPGKRVMRGGSFAYAASPFLDLAYRGSFAPKLNTADDFANIGFRCARDYQPGD